MIIESVHHDRQLEFLENAVSVWKWAMFPLHKIKRNYDGRHVWCGCKLGLQCPRVGKCPRVKWGDRANHIQAGQFAKWIDDGFTNFGIHLGWSDLVVIDIDTRNNGFMTWKNILGSTSPPPTWTVRTSEGGEHWYFRAGAQTHLIGGIQTTSGKMLTNIALGPGVELLSGQHFVASPFSVHKKGSLYKPFFQGPLALFEGV